MKKAYIVYGNHGNAPVQLEDYHEYLFQALAPQGFEILYSFDPVPGEFNVLIEFFDGDFVHKIRKAKKVPGTKMLMIATEFVTGKTFNDFTGSEKEQHFKRSSLPKPIRWLGSKMGPILFPTALRRFMLRSMPSPYLHFRAIYRRHFGLSNTSVYSARKYWLDRFEHFSEIVPLCMEIWCVSPHQIPAYIQEYGSRRIKLMPLISWTSQCTNPDQGKLIKDIDFLFTGSMTPYRESLLKELVDRGYNVIVGPPTWPRYMRDHFVARSKVCLQIRQNPRWKYPSVMRYHHLLNSGAVIVADLGTEPCLQEEFLISTPAGEFVETCSRILKNSDLLETGRKAQANYYRASEEGRTAFRNLLSDLFPAESPAQVKRIENQPSL